MSDRLEEIKTKWKTIRMGHTVSISEDDVDWLIAEVERLCNLKLVESVTEKRERENKIESLTKEIEEKVQIINGHPLKMKEAKQKLEDKIALLKTDLGLTERWNSLQDQLAQLTAENAELRLRGNISCTKCGAVYPNPHTVPCNL